MATGIGLILGLGASVRVANGTTAAEAAFDLLVGSSQTAMFLVDILPLGCRQD